jgi:signal transduction histidine kinase
MIRANRAGKSCGFDAGFFKPSRQCREIRRAGCKPKITIRGETDTDFVRLWFEDNGIGIDKGAETRLFQMFQRLNVPGRYEGTGLGRAIGRKAVERMGGKIGVESESGKGSRFWVELKTATKGELAK